MADALFTAVAHEMLADSRVSKGKVFGHDGLKVGGKVFATDMDGELLVKLPVERCDALLAQGGRPFEPMGRRMRNWVLVPVPESGDPLSEWLAIADEAREHVAARA
jgi:TfoX/Sxy family transcriptional regulator of competence genes